MKIPERINIVRRGIDRRHTTRLYRRFKVPVYLRFRRICIGFHHDASDAVSIDNHIGASYMVGVRMSKDQIVYLLYLHTVKIRA